jgi:Protein of unknown function (DUF3455)
MKNINLIVVGSFSFTAIFSLSDISVFAMIAAPAVPENLKPPQTEKVAFSLSAKGVQIYQCSVSKNDATKFEWVFKAPEAELFDQAKTKVGQHYGGPTWESNDGSKIQGEVKARTEVMGSKAIPWLLLGAKKPEGKGIFSPVKSIQRLNTLGGSAPATGCDRTQANTEIRVPYTAQYYFYVDSQTTP